MTHGQCYARPTVTFPVAGHRCRATGTKLYCLVTEAHVCEQLAQGRYRRAERPGVELATSRRSPFISLEYASGHFPVYIELWTCLMHVAKIA